MTVNSAQSEAPLTPVLAARCPMCATPEKEDLFVPWLVAWHSFH